MVHPSCGGEKPNVLFIAIDARTIDRRFGGHPLAKTPHLDRWPTAHRLPQRTARRRSAIPRAPAHARPSSDYRVWPAPWFRTFPECITAHLPNISRLMATNPSPRQDLLRRRGRPMHLKNSTSGARAAVSASNCPKSHSTDADEQYPLMDWCLFASRRGQHITRSPVAIEQSAPHRRNSHSFWLWASPPRHVPWRHPEMVRSLPDDDSALLPVRTTTCRHAALLLFALGTARTAPEMGEGSRSMAQSFALSRTSFVTRRSAARRVGGRRSRGRHRHRSGATMAGTFGEKHYWQEHL